MRKAVLACVLAVSGMLCASSAMAQADSALDKAMDNLPIEKIIGQLLGSIDFKALGAGMEQAAKDVAEGKPPQMANSPALQEMQAKLQKQIGIVGPELMKAMALVMVPLMAEMKAEIGKEFGSAATPAPAR
jgi:hypothetical protein